VREVSSCSPAFVTGGQWLTYLGGCQLHVEGRQRHDAVGDELGHDALDGVDGDGEPDAGREARARENGRVDTHHVARRV
jgi:hypothetical protein